MSLSVKVLNDDNVNPFIAIESIRVVVASAIEMISSSFPVHHSFPPLAISIIVLAQVILHRVPPYPSPSSSHP